MLQSIQPWHWRSLPLNQRSGSDVFEALFHHPVAAPETGVEAIATLLESPSAIPTPVTSSLQARYSICAGAPRVRHGKPQIWTPAVGKILPQLRQLLQHSAALEIPDPNLPFTGGWLGWLGYDLAWEIEQLPSFNPDPLPFPIAYWYEPDQFAILDHHAQILWLAVTHLPHLDTLQSHLENPPPPLSFPSSPFPHPPSPYFHTSQSDYETTILRAKKYIQAGDIFQANLSLRFEAHTLADNWSVYRSLQQINPSPFASYWQTPWGAVISCSPERLVELRGREAQTRPIAGTRSRGSTLEGDRQQAQDLLNDAKENAEHIMLVDLERNDLGRVCEWGSVTVDELLTIERYSHVMHLVSNVRGRLRLDCDAIALIRALFPGGTITGCPKVRCMEIIEELEPVRRSLFYGSCGYLDWRGNLDLNILIRTLLSAPAPPSSVSTKSATDRKNVIWGQVGAGIVADSNPELEWFEALHKAQAQLAALATKSYNVKTQ